MQYSIRQEAEEADGAPNFLLLHSLGGGSGSGLGSRLLEHLREAGGLELPQEDCAQEAAEKEAEGLRP
ncbi:tubulin gamma chain [Haematococcus lacustris]|uniref:Tubulin gamma chain n=1 Tax=Haematococcus lacustris TaxID=44745 RepID=A0A699ZMV0_HAELA|nr:tubulin gamma chain [Haematococcus lacustris]